MLRLLKQKNVLLICLFSIVFGALFYAWIWSVNPKINFFKSYQVIDTIDTTMGLPGTEEEIVIGQLDLISFISANVRLIDISTERQRIPNNSFCVFENETAFLRTDLFQQFLLANKWLMYESESIDPRRLSPWRNQSELVKIATHVFISSPTGELIHLKLLIPRHNYFWISEYHSDSTMLKIGNSTKAYKIAPIAVDNSLLSNLTSSFVNNIKIYRPADLLTFNWHMEKSRFLECDYEGKVWPFWDFYQEIYQSYDVKLVQETLAFFREQSLKFKVPLEIYAGTLLGWYRQCDFIPYSSDLDFAVNISSITNEFFQALWHSGLFPMSQRFGTTKLGLEINGFFKNQVKVDIFSWNIEGDQIFTYYYLWDYLLVKRIGYEKRTELCTGELLGQLVYVSCDPFSHIRTEYGIRWFEPKSGTVTHFLVDYKQYSKSETEQFNLIYHVYNNRTCSNPTIMQGCD